MKQGASIPKRVELCFDALYLLFAAGLGIFMLCTAQTAVQRLWGTMALTLAVGDAFHLVPRMAAALTGNTQRFFAAMGVGKLLTSITMTVFYLLLWRIGLQLFGLSLPFATALIVLLAAARILLCLMPQNGWTSVQPSARWNLYRNLPFVLEGAMVLGLYARFGAAVPAVRWMWLAILLSFAFYLPVVFWAQKKPKLGMLMLPKTCAYVWMLSMGLFLGAA